MAVELLLPKQRKPAPGPPERIALDMAFGAGNPAILGDKSRYRSHGAITTATPAAGLHGYCLDFEFANPDYVTIPNAHTQLGFVAEDFSIIARIRPESLVTWHHFIMRGDTSTDGWAFYCRNDGRVQFSTFQALARQDTLGGVANIAINTWYTIGMSRAGATVTLYVNGIDITIVPAVHINPLPSPQDCRICSSTPAGTFTFDGLMEFMRVFRGVALTLSEHLAWHNALA